MAILDQNGNPIDRRVLSEQQTADPSIVTLNRTWELHPAAGMTPARVAALLRQAETGWLLEQCDLFNDMEEDDHIFTEMSKRRRALLAVGFAIQEPPNADQAEKDATVFLQEVISELPMKRIILEMADAIGKGFSAQEIEWHLVDKTWLPKTLTPRPQRWFRLDYETRMQLRLRDGSASGAELWPFGWMLHQHPAKSGYVARQALFRVLVWPWLYRRYGARDLAEFLEVYGLPVKLGTYPNGADDKQKGALYRALMSIGHNAAGIIPEGMKIEFQDAARGAGGNDPFLASIAWAEKSISKAILGGTLNSSADGGTTTNALGNVHAQAATDIRDADAAMFEETLARQLLLPILALNGFAPRRVPKLAFDLEPEEDVAAWVAAISPMIDRGLPVPVSHALDKLKVPAAQDGEAVLHIGVKETVQDDQSGAPPLGDKPGVASALAAAGVASAGQVPSPADYVDTAADTLAAAAAPAWASILDQVRGLVANAKDLPELRDKLLAAYQDLPSDELAKVMALGFAAADLAGRADVKAGT